MINEVILNMMTEEEKSEYEYNNHSYWQSIDELGFKREEPVSYDTGHLTVGDLARIVDAQFNMCQVFENKMRIKYCG